MFIFKITFVVESITDVPLCPPLIFSSLSPPPPQAFIALLPILFLCLFSPLNNAFQKGNDVVFKKIILTMFHIEGT